MEILTRRYYDKISLLKPAFVDSITSTSRTLGEHILFQRRLLRKGLVRVMSIKRTVLLKLTKNRFWRLLRQIDILSAVMLIGLSVLVRLLRIGF